MTRDHVFVRNVGLLFLVFWSGLPVGAAPQETTQDELSQIRADLARSARERIADADTSLFQVSFSDPEYPVAECVKPKPQEDTVSLDLPGVGAVVCGNTEAGSKVAAWRRWYCEGVNLSPELFEKCVLGEWQNGEPTLRFSLRLGQKVSLAVEGAEPVRGEISPFDIDGVLQKYESCRPAEVEWVWKELENGDVVVTRTRPIHCK